MLVNVLPRLKKREAVCSVKGAEALKEGAGAPKEGAGAPKEGAGAPNEGVGAPKKGVGAPKEKLKHQRSILNSMTPETLEWLEAKVKSVSLRILTFIGCDQVREEADDGKEECWSKLYQDCIFTAEEKGDYAGCISMTFFSSIFVPLASKVLYYCVSRVPLATTSSAEVSSAVEYLGLSAKGAGFSALLSIEFRTISVFNNDRK